MSDWPLVERVQGGRKAGARRTIYPIRGELPFGDEGACSGIIGLSIMVPGIDPKISSFQKKTNFFKNQRAEGINCVVSGDDYFPISA
jgi:hypothetical protein